MHLWRDPVGRQLLFQAMLSAHRFSRHPAFSVWEHAQSIRLFKRCCVRKPLHLLVNQPREPPVSGAPALQERGPERSRYDSPTFTVSAKLAPSRLFCIAFLSMSRRASRPFINCPQVGTRDTEFVKSKIENVLKDFCAGPFWPVHPGPAWGHRRPVLSMLPGAGRSVTVSSNRCHCTTVQRVLSIRTSRYFARRYSPFRTENE
jgi:hypothetical protein